MGAPPQRAVWVRFSGSLGVTPMSPGRDLQLLPSRHVPSGVHWPRDACGAVCIAWECAPVRVRALTDRSQRLLRQHVLPRRAWHAWHCKIIGFYLPGVSNECAKNGHQAGLRLSSSCYYCSYRSTCTHAWLQQRRSCIGSTRHARVRTYDVHVIQTPGRSAAVLAPSAIAML